MQVAQIIALTRSRMLFLQSYLLFNNYPNNLGNEILEAVRKYKQENKDEVKGFFQNFSDPSFFFGLDLPDVEIEKKILDREEQLGKIFGIPIELFKITEQQTKDSFKNKVYKTNPFDFEWSLLTKELVTLISFLEAYIANSIRVICRLKPDIIKKNLGLKMGVVFVYEDKKQIENGIDQKLRTIGTSSIKRLKFLHETCNITNNLTRNELNNLLLYEQMRHTIVHNAGRIDSSFKRKTGLRKLKQDHLIPLKITDLENLYEICFKITHQLFPQIIQKYFKMYLKTSEFEEFYKEFSEIK